MENIVRFFEWKKGAIEVPAHEAIAFRIWDILPSVGTTEMDKQSILLEKMIQAAKDVIDIEVRLENQDSDSINEILQVYRNLPDANEFELNEIRVEFPDQKVFFLGMQNPKLPVKINWYRFKKQMNRDFRYYWKFEGKS